MRNDSTLADSILNNIGEAGQLKRKTYQRRLPEDPSKDYYFIHRLTGNIEPVLVEYGFIDNIKDSNKLKNNLLDYVEGAVKALAEYSGYTYTPPKQNDNSSNETYTVQKGDTLYSIARKFDTTVDKIKVLNNLNSDVITEGQTLKISDEDNQSNRDTYTVQKGDTLYSIAQKFNTTVDELKKINNLTSNTLSIGQILKVKETPDNENNLNYYTVQKGDSLYSIAKKFKVNLNDLIKANNLLNTTIKVGDKLLIPINTDNTYTVVSGDSLYSIAKKFNTTVNELKRLNNLNSNLLTIGQTIIIK